MRKRGALLLFALCLLLTSCATAAAPPDRPDPRSARQTAADPLTAVFLGDSYTVGAGDPAPDGGYVATVARRLRWTARPAAQSGTGYVSDGRQPGRSPYAGRLDEVAAAEPDIVVVQGSTNDVGQPPDAVGRAAGELYEALRSRLPGARVVVLGPLSPPGVDPVGVRTVRDELAQAADAAELPFIDPIAEGWLSPPDGLFADPVHPNRAGYRQLAVDLSAALRELGM